MVMTIMSMHSLKWVLDAAMIIVSNKYHHTALVPKTVMGAIN